MGIDIEILTFKDDRRGSKLNVYLNILLFIFFIINLIIFGILGDYGFIFHLHALIPFILFTFLGFLYFLVRLKENITSSRYFIYFSLGILIIINIFSYFILPLLSIRTISAYVFFITEAYPWMEEIQRFVNLIIIFDILNSLDSEKIKNLSKTKKLLISYVISLLIFIFAHYSSVDLIFRIFDMTITGFFIFIFIILTENYYFNLLSHISFNKIQILYPTSTYFFLLNLNQVPFFSWKYYFLYTLFLVIIFISSCIIYLIRKEGESKFKLINSMRKTNRRVTIISIFLFIINTIFFFVFIPSVSYFIYI